MIHNYVRPRTSARARRVYWLTHCDRTTQMSLTCHSGRGVDEATQDTVSDFSSSGVSVNSINKTQVILSYIERCTSCQGGFRSRIPHRRATVRLLLALCRMLLVKKGKLVPVRRELPIRYAIKAYEGVDINTHIFLTSVLVGGEWSASRPGRFTPGERTRHPSHRRLGGSQSQSGRYREVTHYWRYRNSNSNPSVFKPVASRYTGCATAPLENTGSSTYLFFFRISIVKLIVFVIAILKCKKGQAQMKWWS
jgi:hypothetical protein